MNLGYVDLSKLDVLILDEADRAHGLPRRHQRMAEHCNPERQTLLFSATMPDRIGKLATSMLKDPVTVRSPCPPCREGDAGRHLSTTTRSPNSS